MQSGSVREILYAHVCYCQRRSYSRAKRLGILLYCCYRQRPTDSGPSCLSRSPYELLHPVIIWPPGYMIASRMDSNYVYSLTRPFGRFVQIVTRTSVITRAGNRLCMPCGRSLTNQNRRKFKWTITITYKCRRPKGGGEKFDFRIPKK